jgi:hypothetical protein
MDAQMHAHMGVGVRTRYIAECFDKDGNFKWREEFENLVVTTGRNALLNGTFDAPAGSVAWFVGLKAAGSVVAGDTMASHAGWAELVAYSQADRPTWTKNGTASGGAMSNSASRASFTASGSMTVAGAFLASDNTKGGTTGTLYGAGDFSAPRAMEIDDVLNVQVDPSVTAS